MQPLFSCVSSELCWLALVVVIHDEDGSSSPLLAGIGWYEAALIDTVPHTCMSRDKRTSF